MSPQARWKSKYTVRERSVGLTVLTHPSRPVPQIQFATRAGTIAESGDFQVMPVGQNSLDGDGELMCCQCNGTMSGYNSAGKQSRASLEASLGYTLGIMIGLQTSSDVKHGDVCFVSNARFGLRGLSNMLEVLSDWLET